MEPEVNQYGGNHVVMTNVMKDVRTRYVNMDTRFSRDINPVGQYTVDFPERIQKVRSIAVTNVELPLSFYNVSKSQENTSFMILVQSSTNVITPYTVNIAGGVYTSATDICNAINSAITSLIISNVTVNFVTSTIKKGYINVTVTFTNPVKSVQLLFATSNTHGFETLCPLTTAESGFDKYNFKSKLGWMMGFRNPVYTFTSNGTINAEAMVDLNGSRYVYLTVDEFNNHAPQSTFVSMLPKSLLNKNILARISVESSDYNKTPSSWGTIEIATRENGRLISDTREYSDDVDLQRLKVQIVDEYGRPLDLNGLDFSFNLVIKHT
jgi:hypothetical protein